MGNIAFKINKNDNVATALSKLPVGEVNLTGEIDDKIINAIEEIPDGHKVAVKDIKSGEQIIKYGISIGTATSDIKKGSWVHLNCMHSNYDERSSHLNLMTGVPTDSIYE